RPARAPRRDEGARRASRDRIPPARARAVGAPLARLRERGRPARGARVADRRRASRRRLSRAGDAADRALGDRCVLDLLELAGRFDADLALLGDSLAEEERAREYLRAAIARLVRG